MLNKLTVFVHALDDALAQTTRLTLVPVRLVDDAGAGSRLAPAKTIFY